MTRLNDRETLRRIEDDVEAALASVAEKHGITIRRAGGTFDNDGSRFVMKVEMKVQQSASEIAAKQRRDFEAQCRWYGLEPDDFGAVFTANGEQFQLTGFNPGAPKFPIQGKRVFDGKGFKFTRRVVDQVIRDRKKIA